MYHWLCFALPNIFSESSLGIFIPKPQYFQEN